MKVVINVQFGGFGLSPQATKRLSELQGRECYFYAHEKISVDSPLVRITEEEASSQTYYLWHAYDVPEMHELANEDWIDLTEEQREERTKFFDQHSLYYHDIARNDPFLVQVVEELGEKAYGKHATLKVIEIPDDVQWHIEEYDGNEHVAENHRTWYGEDL